MKNFLRIFTIVFISSFILAACSSGDSGSEAPKEDEGNKDGNEVVKVVTTFTLLEDIVKQIGGEHVDVYNLVPVGTDPHEYEPLPEDMAETEDADVIFYNGLNLEGGDTGWLSKLIDATGKDWDIAFEAAEGVEPMYLSSEDGTDEEVNPHSFLDPMVGIQMAENVRDALVEISPDNKEAFEEGAEKYLAELQAMHEEYETKIGEIPEEDRILVTSERAYQYMADRYGLKEGFIWAIDTEDNGTPEQIKSLVEFVKEEEPPALFVESNVDKRPMETVSSETGVEIYSEIFSDEIGAKGEEGDTYLKFLQFNIDKIHEGLTQ